MIIPINAVSEPVSVAQPPDGLQKCREQIALLIAKKHQQQLERSERPSSEQYQPVVKALVFEITVNPDPDEYEFLRQNPK